MKSIMTLTATILDHIPKPATGWAVYRQAYLTGGEAAVGD